MYGSMNADEGFYAIASRSVAQGEIPYRDFGFPQPPLALYANAPILRLIGFGLFAQRTVNGFWAAMALAIAAVWLGRRAGLWLGVGLAISFSLSATWMYFVHLGKTYGLSTLLVMLGAWTFLSMRAGPRRNFTLGTLGALGICTRLPIAPFFAVLLLIALLPDRLPTLREVFAAIGGLAFTALAIPFWITAPVASKFWLFDLHRLSLLRRDWHLSCADIISLAPATWLLTGSALVVVVLRRRWCSREFGIILAAGGALAVNLLPSGVYEEYGVPFLLPLSMVAIALLFDDLKHQKILSVAAVTVVIAVQLCAAPLLNSIGSRHAEIPSCWLSTNAPPYNHSLPGQLATASRIVQKFLAADAPFIGSNIILAAETGRAVPAELRMGPFSFTVEFPAAQAGQLHLVTHELLDKWFARPDVTVLAFFQRPELNYGWTIPAFGRLRPEFYQQWFTPALKNFEPAYETQDDFLILVRKPSSTAP
jgi:hypothetical protein